MLFISYSSSEKDLADRIRNKLKDRGVECWMAPQSIPGGSNYAKEIPAAIRDCEALLLVLTEKAQESVWVPKEVDMAVSKRKDIYPLHMDDSELTPDFELYLKNVQQIEAQNNLDRVLDLVSELLLKKLRTSSSADVASDLPAKISLMALLGVNSTGEIDLDRIRAGSDVTKSLAVPVGRDEQGRTVYLDIHHKGDGPNGISYGPPGSGKTEFIITFLLSLALHFSPDDICFHLIDFMRSGAYDTLRGLPHLAGSYTDTDNREEALRFVESLEKETEKRKKLLEEYGADNIYQYLKKRKESGNTIPPMPHILIAVDELCTLKKDDPETAYRITCLGEAENAERYGFHILFCTNRPAAVINDQIFRILNYQVCSAMYQNIEQAGELESDNSCPGRLYFASPSQDLVKLIQVAYTGDRSALPVELNFEMRDAGLYYFAKKQSEALAGLIARYELD